MQQRNQDASAACTDRVTEGNCTAMNVHTVILQMKSPQAGDALCGESLVEFKQIDIIQLHIRFCEYLLDRCHWRNKDVFRRNAARG